MFKYFVSCAKIVKFIQIHTIFIQICLFLYDFPIYNKIIVYICITKCLKLKNHIDTQMKLKCILIIAAATIAIAASARDTYNFNSNWRIGKEKKTVTLPHAWNEDDAYKVGIKDMRDSVVVS